MGGVHPGEGGEFGGGVEVDVGVDYGDCSRGGLRGGHCGMVVVSNQVGNGGGLVVVLLLGKVV